MNSIKTWEITIIYDMKGMKFSFHQLYVIYYNKDNLYCVDVTNMW